VFQQQNSSTSEATTVGPEPALPSQTSSINDQGYLNTVDDSSYDNGLQWDTINWDSDVESDGGSEEEPSTASIPGSDSSTGPKVETYPCAGEPIEPFTNWNGPTEDWNPWTPFQSAYDFKLARWFIESQTPKTGIDRFFSMGLAVSGSTFSSGHTLHKLIDCMEIDMGENCWSTQKMEFCDSTEVLYYRNPVQIISYLLRQRAYINDLVYAPIHEYNAEGERVYSEMHTANWWWETQVKVFQLFGLVPY